LPEQGVDPYRLLRLLEETTERHARTVKSLERVLNRLRRDIDNEELQLLVRNYLRRLRVMRRRIERSLEGSIDFEGVDGIVVENIATLSEYMLIVGYVYEEEVLRKARILAKRGARLLQEEYDQLADDMDQLARVSEKLQKIVDKYY